MTTATMTTVPADSIAAGDNDRTAFDTDALAQLAASIAEHGLAQPPTLRPLADGRYEIVAGERRVRAMRLLGWDTVPAIVRTLDDHDAAAVMLAENTARADLDPVEEGAAYRKRLDAGQEAADIARTAGVSVQRLRNRAQLLDLVDEAQQMVRSGGLSLGMANALHGLDSNRQRIVLRAMGRTDLTWQAYTELVAKLKDDQLAEGAESMFDVDSFLEVQEAAAATAPEAQPADRSDLLDLVRRMAVEIGPDHPLYDEAMEALRGGAEDTVEAPAPAPAPERPAARPEKLTNATRPKVTVEQLLAEGALAVGQQLTATYHGCTVAAQIADESGAVEFAGERYGSLSAAAKAVRGGSYYVSGWSFWQLEDGRKVDALRYAA